MAYKRTIDDHTYQELLIVVIIGAFTALVLFIVDRWRKTIQGKRKRRLERSLEMRTFSGKQVPDGMQQFVREKVQNSATVRKEFMNSVPIGAGQRGWGPPGDPKREYVRYKTQVSVSVRQNIERFLSVTEGVARKSYESLAEVIERARPKAESHGAQAMVAQCHQEDMVAQCRKYEVAKFGQRELSEREFKQTKSYVQQLNLERETVLHYKDTEHT